MSRSYFTAHFFFCLFFFFSRRPFIICVNIYSATMCFSLHLKGAWVRVRFSFSFWFWFLFLLSFLVHVDRFIPGLQNMTTVCLCDCLCVWYICAYVCILCITSVFAIKCRSISHMQSPSGLDGSISSSTSLDHLHSLQLNTLLVHFVRICLRMCRCACVCVECANASNLQSGISSVDSS